jgi:hypothetical protein
MDADVLLQAGHEGGRRNDGTSTTASLGASGTARPEREMTPIVADAAAEILRDSGVAVVRVPGVYPKVFDVRLGLALHFDGSGTPCASGASVGYPEGSPPGSNRPTAELWKEIWGIHWPFKFMPDNFTRNLRGYYGYSRMRTDIAEMLIEFGEISCPEQDAWLQPRLEWIGSVVAFFCGQVLDVDIPDPGPFDGAAPEPVVEPDGPAKPWSGDLAVIRTQIDDLRGEVESLRALIDADDD